MSDPTFALSRDEVRELDRRAIHDYGVPGIVLMENAGRGALDVVWNIASIDFHDFLDPSIPVVICCGKGNNGGDGFVIARHMDALYDVDVRVLLFADPTELSEDAYRNFQIATRGGVPVTTAPRDFNRDWISQFFQFRGGIAIDALFGTGLSGPIRPPITHVIDAINASGPIRFAVDIPSGLDCDTGEPLGPTVRATHTATFVALKKGFLNTKSREWTGEVHVIDIGAPRKLIEEFRAYFATWG